MAIDQNGDLFPDVRNPESLRVINDRCLIRTQDDYCVVIVSGIVLAQSAANDHMAEAYAMVSLVEQGGADQNEVAQALGCSSRTVRRHQRRFESGGLASLGHGSAYPEGRHRVKGARTQLIQRLKAEGHSNREIARRLGVSEMAIRKMWRRLGWKELSPEPNLLPLDLGQGVNPNQSALATSSTVPFSPPPASTANPAPPSVASTAAPCATFDTDPMDRSGDRLLAYLGLLDDAAPLFGSQANVARAGVLLAVPPLVHSGVFECAQQI